MFDQHSKTTKENGCTATQNFSEHKQLVLSAYSAIEMIKSTDVDNFGKKTKRLH